MSEWQDVTYFFIGGAMLLLAVLGLGLAAVMPGMDRWNKRFFMCFFATLAMGVGIYFAETLTFGDQPFFPLEKIVTYLESVPPATMMVMLTVYLLHCCEEDWRKSPLLRAVLAPLLIYFIALGIAQFTTYFYYITPDNLFVRGPWYPLGMALLIAAMAINLVGVIRRRNKLTKKRFHALLFFLIPLTVALIVHSFVSAFLLLDVGITISALSMFAIVVSEQIEQYFTLQQEIAHQRSKLMVLQMRPHFIHNTMTSIYYLCDEDPKAAQRVTLEFNTYLRKNFNAIVSDEVIPFSEELEHTRAYLAVEQAQFANKLQVEFDTPHTQFHMPPLTLQPLAENAVKHGMSPTTVPLKVRIRTRKTDSGSEVVVEDDGVGFNPADIDKPHTTLTNIQQRLEMMCNGQLVIAPREGGGTVVTVTIP